MLLVIWSPTSPSRKLVISIFLSSGIFVISASIIRTGLTLSLFPSSYLVNSWGVRETFVGIVAVNLAIFAPILRKAFWTHGSFELAVRQSRGTSWDTIHDNRREHAIRETTAEDRFVHVDTTFEVRYNRVDRETGIRLPWIEQRWL
jgi:hypothetical protein